MLLRRLLRPLDPFHPPPSSEAFTAGVVAIGSEQRHTTAGVRGKGKWHKQSNPVLWQPSLKPGVLYSSHTTWCARHLWAGEAAGTVTRGAWVVEQPIHNDVLLHNSLFFIKSIKWKSGLWCVTFVSCLRLPGSVQQER